MKIEMFKNVSTDEIIKIFNSPMGVLKITREREEETYLSIREELADGTIREEGKIITHVLPVFSVKIKCDGSWRKICDIQTENVTTTENFYKLIRKKLKNNILARENFYYLQDNIDELLEEKNFISSYDFCGSGLNDKYDTYDDYLLYEINLHELDLDNYR